MNQSFYLMALITGFLGSAHCLGMCGGLVTALSLSGPGRQGGPLFHLLYSLGRLITYTLIGAAVGWLGSMMAYTAAFERFSHILLTASDFFIIAVGLGTAGAFKKVNLMGLEFPGPVKIMVGAGSWLNGFPRPLAALPLGLLFGFLPCGLVYAVAITAAQTASPLKGGLTLLYFGIGTVPALFSFGTATHWLSARGRGGMIRGAGVMVALMGLYNLGRHLQLLGILPGEVSGCFC